MVDILKIPYLTTRQMIEVDRLMVEVYGIQLIQMMENAGRHLSRLASDRFLDGYPVDKRIIILAGSGGNGGGAMVAARNLHNWGARVEVFLAKSANELSGVIRQQANILQEMGIDLLPASDLHRRLDTGLIIDGILGYRIKGAPHSSAAEMIIWANDQEVPILSLDVPSGLDPGSGQAYQPAINATATMTLALPKAGLNSEADITVGELYLADIGVPHELYLQLSPPLNVPSMFTEAEIIRLG